MKQYKTVEFEMISASAADVLTESLQDDVADDVFAVVNLG